MRRDGTREATEGLRQGVASKWDRPGTLGEAPRACAALISSKIYLL